MNHHWPRYHGSASPWRRHQIIAYVCSCWPLYKASHTYVARNGRHGYDILNVPRAHMCVSEAIVLYARIGGNSFLPSQRRTSNFPFCPPVPVRSYSAKTTRCQPHRISIIQPLRQGIIHQLRQRILLYGQAATTPDINQATTTYVIVAPPATFEDHLHCYLILPLHVLRNSNRLASCTHRNCVDSLIVTSQSGMWV